MKLKPDAGERAVDDAVVVPHVGTRNGHGMDAKVGGVLVERRHERTHARRAGTGSLPRDLGEDGLQLGATGSWQKPKFSASPANRYTEARGLRLGDLP